MELKESVLGKLNESFFTGSDGLLRYQGRLYVPMLITYEIGFLRKLMVLVIPFIRDLVRYIMNLEKFFGGKV